MRFKILAVVALVCVPVFVLAQVLTRPAPMTVPAAPDSYTGYLPGMIINQDGYPSNGVFGFGSNTYSETFSVRRRIPATSTTHTAPAALAGYAFSESPNAGVVGVFGQASMSADAPGGWGANFLTTNCAATDVGCALGGHNTILWGIEVDVNERAGPGGVQPLGSVMGVDVTGGSNVRPTGGARAFHVGPMDGYTRVLPWTEALLSEDGAALAGVRLGALANTAPVVGDDQQYHTPHPVNSASQPVVLRSIDGAGTVHEGTIQTLPDGTMVLTPGTPGAPVQVPSLSTPGPVTLGEAGVGPGHGSAPINLLGVDAGGSIRQASVTGTPDGGINLVPAQPSAPVTAQGNLVVTAGFATGGHVAATNADAPILSACGSGTVLAGSNDTRGTINLPAGQNTCAVNFRHPSGTPPFCVATSSSIAYPAAVLPPNAGGVILAVAASNPAVSITWHCDD